MKEMNVLVEGWLSYPHSYSIVNAHQILSLSKKDGINVYINELPAYKDEWKKISLERTVLTKEEVETLNRLKRYDGNVHIDIVYRIAYPYDLIQTRGVGSVMFGKNVPLFLFYTAEFQTLKDHHFVNGTPKHLIENCVSGKVVPITPSKWSAEALKKLKIEPFVVPHGVDITKFYPMRKDDKECLNWRKENDIPDNAFVFLNVSAMTGNKNIKMILKTIYKISMLRDNVYLVLKGIGSLYTCESNINAALKELVKDGSIHKKQYSKIAHRVIFIDDLYSYQELRVLYNACDCYLSPYVAEGFNMPVLEAAACGLPSIVSKGGATDDFTFDTFTKYPKTYTCRTPQKEFDVYLVVDECSLQEKMLEVMEDTKFLLDAKIEGPKYVLQNFTWDKVTDVLYNIFKYAIPDIKPNMINNCHFDLAYTP